jgi:hypothetical protein
MSNSITRLISNEFGHDYNLSVILIRVQHKIERKKESLKNAQNDKKENKET